MVSGGVMEVALWFGGVLTGFRVLISAVLWDDRSILKDRATIPILEETSPWNYFNMQIGKKNVSR